MDSIYYCFLCDAKFIPSGKWNAHLTLRFFSTFSTFLKLMFFCINIFFHIFFISNALFSNFFMWYVWTCLNYTVFILIALLSNFNTCLYMIEYVQDTFDFRCAGKVRSFTWTGFFFLPELGMSIDFLSADFFFFFNQVNNNALQQQFNRRSPGSHVNSDWWGDAADWATDGMFDQKNQPQMQEMYKIFFQRSCSKATGLWASHKTGEMPPLC